MELEDQPAMIDPSKSTSVSAPITVKDVLRAIFLPVPLPRRVESAEATGVASAPAGEAEAIGLSPAIIDYAPPLLAPRPEALPIGRVVTLVAGTIITIGLASLGQILFALPYLYANVSLTPQQRSTRGLILYGMALVAWLIVLLFEIAPPDGSLFKRGPHTRGGSMFRPLAELVNHALAVRLALGGAALIASALTYILTANNTFSAQGVAAWAMSVVLWMLTLSERDPLQLLDDWRKKLAARPLFRFDVRVIVLTLAIMGIAAFFRFYLLDAIPIEMTSDHVEKLLDANDIANRGLYSVFFPRNGGREAIQMYLVALGSRAFGTGVSFLTLKLVSALEALALIPLMIILGREVIDEETGLFAATLLAISWWHTAVGRLALRIVLTPLIFTLVLISLIRGMRTGHRKPWLWAGFWMGVGFYAYQAMRIVPLVALAAFIFASAGAWLRQRRERQLPISALVNRQALNLVFAGIVALAFFVPMLRFWHDQPNVLWGRVLTRTTSSEIALQGEPLAILLANYWDALRMFNWRGDISWFTALPGAPTLGVVTGVLLVLGVTAWVVRLKTRRDPVDGFLIVAVVIMLLPSTLALAFPIENPNVTRGSGVIPIVFLIAAWPLALIRQSWTTALGGWVRWVFISVVLGAILLPEAWINYDWYFTRYESSYRHSALNPSEVAEAVLRELGTEGSLDNVWLEGYPFWHDYRAIGIEVGDITWDHAIVDFEMLRAYLENNPEFFRPRPLVFIVHPEDTEGLAILGETFPEGIAKWQPSMTEGRDFILFVVRASDTP